MTQLRAVIVMGPPSSGKTTYALSEPFSEFAYISPEAYDNDDALRKAIIAVINMDRNIIIDDCNGTPSERKWYTKILQQYTNKYQLECHYMQTMIRDCIQNSRNRQSRGGNRLNKTQFVRFRNRLLMPDTDEGFAVVVEIDFIRSPNKGSQGRAIVLSLRSICFPKTPGSFPKGTEQFMIYPDVDKTLKDYFNGGHKLIILANIPDIGEKRVSEERAQDAIIDVIKRLGVPIDAFYYSPHLLVEAHNTTMPNVGMALIAKERHALDLSQSTMVGHSEVEKWFAQQAGFGLYLHRDNFFWGGQTRLTDKNPEDEAKKALEVKT